MASFYCSFYNKNAFDKNQCDKIVEEYLQRNGLMVGFRVREEVFINIRDTCKDLGPDAVDYITASVVENLYSGLNIGIGYRLKDKKKKNGEKKQKSVRVVSKNE